MHVASALPSSVTTTSMSTIQLTVKPSHYNRQRTACCIAHSIPRRWWH